MKEKRNIFICLIFLSICWAYMWGICANPFQVSCFNYAGWGDHLQSYLGWISYAKDTNTDIFSRSFSGWTWPVSSEMLYADTIPILSIIIKPFFNLFSIDFQYFSIASLINLLATYYCGLLIGKHFKIKIGLSSLLGILLALSPIAIIRITGHEALSLHFFIVYPITLLIIRSVSNIKWSLLMFGSLGTHAYFFPIILLLKICSSCYNFRNNLLERRKLLILVIKDIFITVYSIALGLYTFGYIGNAFSSTKNDELWSANLLALIDPQDYSLIFDKLNIVRPYQWEGYSYLGVLFIILLTIASVIKIKEKKVDIAIFPKRSSYYFILLLFLLIAIGSPIYFGENLIIKKSILMYPGSFLNTFRATGRFMWPIYYSLVIWSFVTIAKRINYKTRLTNIFIILVLLLMTENHFFVLNDSRNQMNGHYISGQKYKKEINDSEIAKLLFKNNYFINATGNPFYLSSSIPSLMPQSINTNIMTNYYPRFARENKNFVDLYSQEPCKILTDVFDQVDDDILSSTLILMENQYIDNCNLYDFNQKLQLPNENVSIFSLSRKEIPNN